MGNPVNLEGVVSNGLFEILSTGAKQAVNNSINSIPNGPGPNYHKMVKI